MTKWTGDSQKSSGQVVLRHDPRAQVLRDERESRKNNWREQLNSHRTRDKTGK
jgi:hypothetical protein